MSAPTLKENENGVWYIHWSEGRRSKRVSTGQKDEVAATTFMAHWILASGATPADAGSVFQFKDLWALYCKKHRVEGVQQRDNIGNHLLKFFGALTPAEITPAKAKEYERQRVSGEIGRPSKPSTIGRELVGCLLPCLNWCAKPIHGPDENKPLISPASVPVFPPPPPGEPRDRWLRTEEINTLLSAAAVLSVGRLRRVERFLWLALETAARKTAILQLTWDRVDFEAGVIHYNVPGRKIQPRKRRASVPISNTLRPMLERAYAERVSNFVLDHSGDVDDAIRRVAKRAGVSDVSAHVLRHTAATHMARRGVSLWLVAGVLADSVKTVEKVYAKHCPDGLAGAVEKISGGVVVSRFEPTSSPPS